MPVLTKQTKEERLVVAIGSNIQVKIFGVPSYKPGTDQRSGDIIAQALVQLLDSWKCRDTVINMTFDTTASKTGYVSAACITLQQSLGRALLWSACRHHIDEVILTQVFNDLKIETSNCSEYSIFSRFQKHFEIVPHASDVTLTPSDKHLYSDDALTSSLVVEWQAKP